MSILNLLSALPDAIFTQEFLIVCVMVFFVCEALFKLPFPSGSWVKPVIAILIGAGLGLMRWALAADALILGAVAGAVTTLTVSRVDYLFSARRSEPKATKKK